ncbi:cell surface glycoprotein CD200 receptor 1-B isoform X2 [Cynoglossus semilaevis]|uniref:CD200 receptor 1 n=1 Tax=Cynoglossus semilaevis TaxID=244447 RepID=A0A3P8VTX9_CYNSE|nr:cell surface glycoprotein CD200 receptor 1 isoform X2 [Cynoglossus semilaevis]
MEMRDLLWIGVAVILLVDVDVWGQDPGDSGPSSPRSQQIKNVVVQNVTVNLGSDVNLTCGEKNWSETLYVLWKINLKHRSCDITREQDSPTVDKCNDRKQLLNATGSTSYLRVPHVSLDDVGIYTCESAFNGGNNKHVFNVTVTVPPEPSAWLEHRSNKMVAVCRAERGKPAANISWSFDTVSPSVDYHDTSDGFISVVSSLELAEDTNIENLICVITHPYWVKGVVLVPEVKKGYFFWLFICIGVIVGVILVVFAFFVQRKIMLTRRANTCDTSLSKFPSTEYVEEVEPYASYVQRVNSIYN